MEVEYIETKIILSHSWKEGTLPLFQGNEFECDKCGMLLWKSTFNNKWYLIDDNYSVFREPEYNLYCNEIII